jgi:hypothetical protein
MPSRRAISEWLTRSPLSRRTSWVLSDAAGGRSWGRPAFLAWAMKERE